jgi:hypothetical protein
MEGVVSQDSEAPRGVDTTTPSMARVYDYLLGGKDNFEVDRKAAELATAAFPGRLKAVRIIGQANRMFLSRSVRYLAEEKGIRQFLDIGAGLPTVENVHQVAQRVAADSRIVYVDHDPTVLVHARALLTSTPEGATAYVDADVHDTDTILREAADTLDFTRPVCLLLIGILHVVEDADDPAGIVSRLLAAVPPGSYLAISHLTADVEPGPMRVLAETFTERMVETVVLRDRDGVARFFDGLRLVPPGVVTLDQWVPGAAPPDSRGELPGFCGLALKP